MTKSRRDRPWRGLPRAARPVLLAVGAIALLSLIASTVVLVQSWRTRRRFEKDVVLLQRQLDTSRRSRIALERNLAEERRRATDLREKLLAEGKGTLASLQEQERALREELAAARADASTRKAEIAELAARLKDARGQLDTVRRESSLAERLIRDVARGVCLVESTVHWVDSEGRVLRYVGLDAAGNARKDESGRVLYAVVGDGPIVEAMSLGTGFLVTRAGHVATNRHVVEPWWQDETAAELKKKGLHPRLVTLRAWFPGIESAVPLTVEQVSPSADVALALAPVAALGAAGKLPPVLELERKETPLPGQPVVLLGYPTGLDALLARLDEAEADAVVQASASEPARLVAELSRRGKVRPLATQGHLGDVLADQLVYDAATTLGGSGGPLFNARGRVVGVNAAVLTGFPGASFGVPVKYLVALLPR